MSESPTDVARRLRRAAGIRKTQPREKVERERSLAIYEMLAKAFGVGSYDPDLTAEPYHIVRARQITVISRLQQTHRASLEQVQVGIDYCRRHGKPVTTVKQFFHHLPDALVEERALRAERSLARRRLDLEHAIRIEQGRTDADSQMWLGRLLRADDHSIGGVMVAWREARQ